MNQKAVFILIFCAFLFFAVNAYAWSAAVGARPAPGAVSLDKAKITVTIVEQSLNALRFEDGVDSTAHITFRLSNGMRYDNDLAQRVPLRFKPDITFSMTGVPGDGKNVWEKLQDTGALTLAYEFNGDTDCVLAPGASAELTVRFRLDGDRYADFLETYDADWVNLFGPAEEGSTLSFSYGITAQVFVRAVPNQ